jgi:hypothetical protein
MSGKQNLNDATPPPESLSDGDIARELAQEMANMSTRLAAHANRLHAASREVVTTDAKARRRYLLGLVTEIGGITETMHDLRRLCYRRAHEQD